MIYADNAATTKISKAAADTMYSLMQETWGNPSSLYSFGQKAKEVLEKSREEIAAVIGKDGATPVPVDVPVNAHMQGLMRIVKTYEKYTVEAGMTGSDAAAMNALMVHPLVGDYEKALKCFTEMKWAHKEFLPQFFKY